MSAPVLYPGDSVLLQLPAPSRSGVVDQELLERQANDMVELFNAHGVSVSWGANTQCFAVSVVAVFRAEVK